MIEIANLKNAILEWTKKSKKYKSKTKKVRNSKIFLFK